MSGLFGGGKKNATLITQYTQLDVQTSAQGLALPIGWGRFAIAGNLIEAGNFQAIPQKGGGGKKGSGGGKGGGGGKGAGKGGAVTSYDYKVDVILALCEGPIQGIANVFINQAELTFPTGLSTVPNTFLPGNAFDSPWPFLSNESYAYTAIVVNHNLDLGSTPVLPNYRFEVLGKFWGTIPSNGEDANPAQIINDLLTNPQYGIGFGPGVGATGSFIDATSWTLYQTYCQAQGLLLSPVLDTQEQISQIIQRWADLTNTWIFWSGGLLKFVPLGDSTVTDGFVTYTPNNTPIVDLTYDDFVFEKGQQPVTVTIVDPADRPNTLKLEVRYRSGFYNAYPVEWKDQSLVDQYGQINAPVAPAHDICNPSIGAIAAQLIGQRAAYIARTYGFKLPWKWFWLEPGDIVTITDPHIGAVLWPVRIRQLDEDQKGFWTVTAEEFPAGLGQGAGNATGTQPTQPGFTGTIVNQFGDPGNVNPPAVIEPQSTFTNGVAQLWIAASGGVNWGGANVFISFDGTTYNPIGPILNPARQGVLTASLPNHTDPDTVDTLSVNLTVSQGTFSGNATTADADADRTLCLITAPYSGSPPIIPCNGELISYGATNLTGQFQYNLTYLRRGQVGTTPAAWSAGSFFSRIDFSPQSGGLSPTLLVYDLPAQYVNKTVYLKFCSFNRFGGAAQDISNVVAYQYTPCGSGHGTGGGGLPAAPTGLTATGQVGAISLTWSANAAADNVTGYNVYRASGLSGTFGSATKIASAGTATTYTDTPLASNSNWTYFVTAVNAVGESGPSNAASATVLATAPILKCRTVTSGASTTLDPTADYMVIIAKTVGSATTVNGPAGTVPDGTRFEIKDSGNSGVGDCDVNNITFQPANSVLVDGLSSFVFDRKGGAFTVTYCTSSGAWSVT